VTADVRVVAATNRDLEAMVAEGRFREDLYFRIKVVELALPPLRERGAADIERLARHFVVAAARRHGRPNPELTPAALERLGRYAWPGNVRELENCLESAVVIADGTRIDASDLPLPDRLPIFAEARVRNSLPPSECGSARKLTSVKPSPVDGPPEPLEVVERRHILAVLRHADGNQSLAAHLLGIGRNTLARKLKAYGEG